LLCVLEKPALWVLELSVATANENALSIVRAALEERNVVLDENVGDLIVGFIYRRFLTGDIDRDDFLAQATDVIDAYQTSMINIDDWCQQIDCGSEPSTWLELVLGDVVEKAKIAIEELENIHNIENDDFFHEN
jgi:hypothetical protein